MLFWREQATSHRTPAHCSSPTEVVHKHIGEPAKNDVALVHVAAAVIVRAVLRLGAGATVWETLFVGQMFFDIAFVRVRIGAA